MSDIKYKRPISINHTVTSAEASANAVSIQLDKNPTVLKDWTGVEAVKDSTGAWKPGFVTTYNISGNSAGYLDITENTGNFVAGDKVMAVGSLNLY